MKLTKELPIMGIVLLPFIYLASIWNDLSDRVPVHWDAAGEVDRYGNKAEIILIPFLLPLLTYVLFSVIPMIDPKKKLQAMGNKYYQLKFVITTITSVLALFIINATKTGASAEIDYIFIILGVLYLVLGNYFKTIKPNYFIGIKTPWTLNDEDNWRETHRLGGKMWFIGGLIIVVLSLFGSEIWMEGLFIIITLIITVIPVVYSYVLFKRSAKMIQDK